MATITGSVLFDRDRSATRSSGDAGLPGIPVVLQNLDTGARCTVFTDQAGDYAFLHVPAGAYRLVQAPYETDGLPSPADFSGAAVGPVPVGGNPPISAAPKPPAGATHLDAVTPNTRFLTVTGADIGEQTFLSGPVIYSPIETILDPCAAVSEENLLEAADRGTFGTFPPGTPANTGAPTEPYPGVTPDFSYVLPNPAVYTPAGGEYTVQNLMTDALSQQIGAWWRVADHTQGNETGRMLVVNGYNPGAVFFRAEVAVEPNHYYLFTAWILNLFKVTGYPDPELGVRVLDQVGNPLYAATLGALIPVSPNAPEWKQIGSVLSSQENTRLTVEFLSEGPEVIGNDYVIDDIALSPIQVPLFLPVKTADRQVITVGETVLFTVRLTNACQSPLTDLFLQDQLPSGFSFVPDTVQVNGTPFPAADPQLGFGLPDVRGGETITVSFQAKADALPVPNPAWNRADLRYAYTPVEGGIPIPFPVSTNEVPVLVLEAADLAVEKTAAPDPVDPGAPLTYTITISNAGPSPARDVTLTDPLPTRTGGRIHRKGS